MNRTTFGALVMVTTMAATVHAQTRKAQTPARPEPFDPSLILSPSKDERTLR